MKFTQKQVLAEIRNLQSGRLNDLSYTPVMDEWFNFAEDWLVDGPYDILKNGLKGFRQRTPEEILVDFHLNNRLKRPLTDKKLDKLLNR